MCEPYPYGRCASDARKRLSVNNAKAKLAKANFLASPTRENQETYEQTKADLIQAQISFDGTKTGRSLAEARIRHGGERQAEAERLLSAADSLRSSLKNSGDTLSSKYLAAITEGDKEGRQAYDKYAKSLMEYQECVQAAKAAPELTHVFNERIAKLKKSAGAHHTLLKEAYESVNQEKNVSTNAAPRPIPTAPHPEAVPQNALLTTVQKSKHVVSTCKEAVENAPDPATRQQAEEALTAAREAYGRAMVAYVASPQGEAELQGSIRSLKAAGKPVRSQQILLERARAYKNAQARQGTNGGSFSTKSIVDGTTIHTRVPELAGKITVMQPHARKQAAEKGFAEETIKQTLENPSEVYPSRSHPGQWRVTGNGICLVGEPEGNSFRVITMYADKVVTAPRADQLSDEKGRIFAERYATGQGRGGGQGV